MNKVRYIVLLFILCLGITSQARDYRKGSERKSAENVTAGCLPGATSSDLDLNNVRALIHTGGDMWWDLANNARYEVPKGSGKQALFAGGIWIGGVDVNGQLRLAAKTYRSQGNDYWPGPLISSGEGIASVTPDICSRYDKHHKITKEEVEEFRSWYNADAITKDKDFPDYSVPLVIQEWPAHGPTDAGAYDYYLAPFADVDGDGVYNYLNGDYPNFIFDNSGGCNYAPERRAENLNSASQKLFGDMTMWWVYNDKGNIHTQSPGAAAIGMEIRGQAFAFSTNDELNNMTFYNYQVINRSTFTLADAYFGVWTDADLGDADDDFVGCDVAQGLGYLYNGKPVDGDGSGKTYGASPPAIGIDFFEGPYQDLNSKDDLSSWEEANRVNLDCQNGYGLNSDKEWVQMGQGDIFNGNINGLNFGDGIVDNERWGMRRFIYNNIDGNPGQQDPETAVEFYNYLKGIWKDGVPMTYGKTGYRDGTLNANFMFPNNTDQCGWGTGGEKQADWNEETANNGGSNDPNDRRFVQSAGPFTLEPGAVNDITIGVVWARANSTPWASVQEVRKADIKAQRLFENCFQLIDGPDAPDLHIVELSNSLIFHISNKTKSNNYLEGYSAKDPFIDDGVPEEDKWFDFQGYQVYQLKNQNVTMAEIDDNNFARQIFQCDVQDDIINLINFSWDPDLQAMIPVEKVAGLNKGVLHSFEIEVDAFASGNNKTLVNYKDYYYVAVAYAHNNYAPYDPVNDGALGKQTAPYLAGRRNVKTYSATPNSIASHNGGTELNSVYGMTPNLYYKEGRGTGYNYLRLTESTKNSILSKTDIPFKADSLIYEVNGGPVEVKVIDPINIISADYELRLSKDSVHLKSGYYNPSDSLNANNKTGQIHDTKWELAWTVDGVDKMVVSNNWIRYQNEMLIPEIGLSIALSQVEFPGKKYSNAFDDLENINNGFVGDNSYYEDDAIHWVDGIPNLDGTTYLNWIRVGSVDSEDDDSQSDYLGRDPDQIYERVLGGTWAPYCLTSKFDFGTSNIESQPDQISFKSFRLASIDFVLTKDESLWTRCPVVEMAQNDADNTSKNSISEGGALRFQLRAAPSRDKDGNYDASLTVDNLSDPNASNFIGATGMSWFPGYAIDVETGERLNIVFGEDSWLVGDNGNDMLWNPTSNIGNIYFNPKFGGKHFIYVFGHNEVTNNVMPAYDFGKTIYDALHPSLDPITRRNNEKKIWKHPTWTCMPLIKDEFAYVDYADMPDNNITIELRAANPYFIGTGGFASDAPTNSNYPTFEFNTDALSVVQHSTDFGKNAMDNINVVPNPYYGYSEYEQTQLDNIVKITNLPERCIVSIYTPKGNLVRKFDKDNSLSYIEWDLKNTYSVGIASGVYIIHISSPELGEKVVKWFGSLRPVDLNSF